MFPRRLCLCLLLTLLLLPRFVAAQAPTAPHVFDASTGTIVDARWKSGLPLGGIGVGKIELLTDGSFGNFTNQHNWDRPYRWAKGAFAAVRVQSGDAAPVARLLRLSNAQEYGNVSDVAHTRMQGWFPRARIDYADDALPITVQLNAFSPLIPHNPKDSSLPVACLAYTLTNPSSLPVHASVLLSWPNLLGWGGRVGTAWEDLSGDGQTPASVGNLRGLRFVTTQKYNTQRQDVLGEDFVGARQERDVKITTTSWDSGGTTVGFWPGFMADGHLPVRAGVVAASKNPAGAVAAETLLPPGQSRTLRFYVVWAMPHHVTVQPRTTFGAAQEPTQAGVAALFDSDPNSRWATARPMQAGDSLVVDLGRIVTPTRLFLNIGAAGTDYPRGLRVEVSDDHKTWRRDGEMNAPFITAALNGGKLDVPLMEGQGRFLRLTNLGTENFYWWSIYDLAVPTKGGPLDLAKASATAYLVKAVTQNVSEDVGHFWQNNWKSAPDIAAYVDGNNDRLLRETRQWQDPVLSSSLPFWLKLKLINCAFPVYSNTILTRDGRFVVQESPIDMGGATGTMDQRMAAHAFYTAFFPELDRAELESFANCQQPDGRITHFDGNIHEVINRPDVGYGITDWPDLSSAWVLQVAKWYRWTGDTAFLSRMQPHVTKAMDWLQSAAKDGNSIPEGGSTYDYEQLPRGAFIYSASCYLGALRAASALSDPAQARAYDAHLAVVQRDTLDTLWNGTFFRKWKSPTTGRTNENSFVANLAGDWLARLTGLPRTLPPDIVHKSIAQTIARHQKPFFPVPPMEVTPEGKLATSACYLLQHEPYLGCEAIYENYVDDGMETLHRVYLCAWELNHSPWDQSLVYNAPGGAQGGLVTYMTCPTTWHVLNALSGASLDLPHQTLYLSPRLTTSQTESHLPVFFPRFWGWLDYAPAAHHLSLRIDRVFAPDARLEHSLYQVSGPKEQALPSMILSSVAFDVDAPALRLPQPFEVKQGVTLDLSPLLTQMALPQKSEVVDFMVKASLKRLACRPTIGR